MTTSQQIANTIISQLGGRRFSMMTGAKNFIATGDGVSFKIGRFSGVKTTHVRITLTPMDDYTMEFLAIRKHRSTLIRQVEGIYADQLTETFRSITGLETRLPKIIGLPTE